MVIRAVVLKNTKLGNGRALIINIQSVMRKCAAMHQQQELVDQYNLYYSAYVCGHKGQDQGYAWLHLEDFSSFDLAVHMARQWPRFRVIQCTRFKDGIRGDILI